jgi:CRP-like cAMP-binding protein
MDKISLTKNYEDKLGELSKFFMDIPFFNCINSEEIKILAKHISFKTISRDHVLFSESEKGNYLYFITSGALDVIAKNENNEPIIIATLQKGELIGEMSIIEDLPRSATVKAKTDCEMYILSKSAFDLVVLKHPHIGVKLLKGVSYTLSQHLRTTSKKLALSLKTITENNNGN